MQLFQLAFVLITASTALAQRFNCDSGLGYGAHGKCFCNPPQYCDEANPCVAGACEDRPDQQYAFCY
ncbi:unnamed protein product [Zymoseptoria tritici ST99CH_1E4]|uniref:Uncharacterized protein n=1 Tax=Zymoseptoria tritici ST99CH_1E4 TaxID=1276532 RepID=A0A2H1GX94_ZYMTR|nr:unnamed protein product [Zymoseptoria tritici ST99CH_1E4]